MWNIEKVVSKGDYFYAVVRNHPNRTKNNYVLYHRVLVENKIGRLLTSEEVVHHKDENKSNNNLDNLQLMTKAEHQRHHADNKEATLLEIKCPCCERVFIIPKNKTHLIKRKQNYTTCSPSCRGKVSSSIQYNKNNAKIYIDRFSKSVIREFKGKIKNYQ